MKRSSIFFMLVILAAVALFTTTKAYASAYDCGGKKSDCCTDKGGVKFYIDLDRKGL